jgi:putative copper export protein
VDYTEFQKAMREKYALAKEREQRRRRLRQRWLRICLNSIVIILTVVLVALIVLRLRQ